jgi:hypothetical protein
MLFDKQLDRSLKNSTSASPLNNSVIYIYIYKRYTSPRVIDLLAYHLDQVAGHRPSQGARLFDPRARPLALHRPTRPSAPSFYSTC